VSRKRSTPSTVTKTLWCPQDPNRESPLAGLSRSAVTITTIPKRIPPERRERMRLVRLVDALAEVARVRIIVDEETEAREPDFGDREPASWHGYKDDGDVYLHRCKYSGHDGDPFDHMWKKLSAAEATVALQNMAARLEAVALAAEVRRLEEAENRRRAAIAKSNLNARLRGRGVLLSR
jgi:hypothetical protein